MDCDYNSSSPSSCLDLKNDSVFDIFSGLGPNCNRGAWTPITVPWLVFFYLKLVIFGLLFLMLGIVCIVLMAKRHSARRFKAKTFVAIDVSIAILGFSRFLFFIVDPFGISGFCTHQLACTIVSRLLNAVAFPSLTAAYTLVFITLWYSAKMRLGRSCIQHWRIIIPLCFIHYFVAILFEIIGIFGTYSVVFLLLGCEAFFTTWGLFVCVTFLVAGCRLLRTVKASIRQSSIVGRDRALTSNSIADPNNKGATTDGEAYNVTRIKLKAKKHHKQAIRKITIITYIAATLGGLYSMLTLVMLVMVCLQLFGECPEEESSMYHSDSDLWLVLRYIALILEYLMAILLLYSINDVRPLVKAISSVISCPKPVEDSDKEKQSKKYFTYSYEETSDSNAIGMQLKRKLSKKNNSIRFADEPPVSPDMATDISTTAITRKPSRDDSNADKEPKTVSSNGIHIPSSSEEDVDSRTSVSQTELNITNNNNTTTT